MSIQEYESEQDLDDEFENIEELNFQHKELQEAVKIARQELEYAIEELESFEEDYKHKLLF
jgi:geranylgeranyl pyrophosphate synthase